MPELQPAGIYGILIVILQNLITHRILLLCKSSGSERASFGCQRSAGRACKALQRRDCYQFCRERGGLRIPETLRGFRAES